MGTLAETMRLIPRPRLTFLAVPAIGLIILAGAIAGLTSGPDSPEASAQARPRVLVAPGIVEPISEELQIAADVVGSLANVPVEEGDHVVKGQLLAEVENADLKATLAQARAVVDRRQAELDKLRNGARAEERQQATAQVDEARALEEQARRDLARKTPLAAHGVESQSTLDQAAALATRAEAHHRALDAERDLVDSAPRPEDVRIAEAALAEARANAAQVQAQLDKTMIHSPIDGVVLSRQKHAGEAVTNLPPTVIVHIGDISRLRVRADVDEADVARVANGQRVWVTADAYPGQRFAGSIVRVGTSLGRKNFRTDRATEKVDTKILETLIDLDAGVRIPVGLRVDVWGDEVAATPESHHGPLGIPNPSQPQASAPNATSVPSQGDLTANVGPQASTP